uniref:Protein regulator of cytokinesis 1-like n=1 Tax=Sphaeramia orbicularis TaxID=375764 RepID=A0A673C9H7_9TELE
MRGSEVHAAESVAYLNRAMVRLQEIWDEIGILEEQRLERTNEVHKHIKDEEDGCTMLQMEKNYRTKLEVMKEHKRQRLEELKRLTAKDCELCDIMCTTPFSINKNSLPSLTQLEAYRAYLDELTKEKRRHLEFVSLKKEIALCMNDLEQQPETSFETDVMCEDDEAFCLSNDNMDALKLLLGQLKERKNEIQLHCSALRTKIQQLWERLQVPQEEREGFSEHMVKSKKKNIEALQIEFQRLEVLKIQSMKSVTEAIRAEIALLWERCFYSQEQCQAFVPYHEDNFTEELLNLHEAEVKALKKYYEDHKELFDGVTKWQENWSLYLELDKKANDPGRFNNRGGNLLKEEKQRSDLQKSLPKLEKILKAQIDLWEQEQGKEFLVGGQKFMEYVQKQWDEHQSEKEKEKLERQLKKTKQTQEDMLYGTTVRTPSKRRMAGNPTPVKLRKLNGTSTMSTPTSFLSSGFGGTMCQSSFQKPPLSTTKVCSLSPNWSECCLHDIILTINLKFQT